MAACIIEDASATTSIYCQTSTTMERASTDNERKTTNTNNVERHSCSFNFHLNQECNRKRQLSQNDSCRSQLPTVTTPTRPTSLFLTTTTTSIERPLSIFRTCLSQPENSPTPLPLIDETIQSPLKFTSLPELSSPPAKRHRPQTLPITPSTSTTPVLLVNTFQSSSTTTTTNITTQFISPTELADKIKDKVPLTIFDCGSPFRHSEHRIRQAILLRVADKISRKRLKTNPKTHSSIDSKQLLDSHFIILYDDTTTRRQQTTNFTNDEHVQLSPAFQAACDEIQHCLSINSTVGLPCPSILILNSSFNNFFDLYPNLCESPQPRSCPSSPHDHDNESSTPPQTAPVLPSSFVPSITNPDDDINSHPMTHIIDGLFIGSELNARNFDELSSEQIRRVVNVTSHVPLYHSNQIRYCHLPADDTQKQNLLEYFDRAYSFIRDAIENNEKVLVHCVAGISRSPAIVIGFLMRYAKMNMNEAYDFVKRKRSIVSPNLNFMGQLLEYEKQLRQHK